MDAPAGSKLSVGRQTWNFVQHFLEMCIAMCVVGTPFILLLFNWGPTAIGYADPRAQFPELSLVAIAVIYAAPMVGWMRFRGMAWRPVLEMAGATVALALVLIGMTWLRIQSPAILHEFISPQFCGPACAVMLLVMLPRLALYTGRSGHHVHRAGARAARHAMWARAE